MITKIQQMNKLFKIKSKKEKPSKNNENHKKQNNSQRKVNKKAMKTNEQQKTKLMTTKENIRSRLKDK
jgi:hypothetical protein